MPTHFEVTDPRGKKVTCTEEAWLTHVLESHPEMEGSEADVQQTIQDPSYALIYQDKDYPTRNIYYRKQPGAYYLKAIVDFRQEMLGELITAFITDSPKSGERLLWKP